MEPVLDGSLFGDDSPCFGCAVNHPIGFRLRFAVEGDAVVTHFTPSDRYQGPPGVMHGGLVMALVDELAAWTLIGKLSRFGFTASFEGKLKKPVRIGRDVRGTGVLLKQSSRVVRVGVTLAQDDVEVVSAELAFAVLDTAAAEALLGGPLPEAWRRFSR
jgi:acyl-coenzyme A thioesterase PaaI-like protein